MYLSNVWTLFLIELNEGNVSKPLTGNVYGVYIGQHTFFLFIYKVGI